MKEWIRKLLTMAPAWRDRYAGELGLGFTLDELEANRYGQLLAAQFPPLFWKLCGLCVIGLAMVLCVRWALRHRHESRAYVVGGFALALACLVPAWPVASALTNAVRDRVEARACAFTHISSGLRGSDWGFGLYYLSLGPRAFYSRRGSQDRAIDAVQRNAIYTAYYACHSGTLASLEPAPPDWKWPERCDYLADLEGLFDFDDEDLAANQAGQITFHQYPIGGLVFVLSFGGFFVAGGLSGLPEFIRKRQLGMLVAALLFVLVGASVLYLNRPLLQDTMARRACALDGTLTNLSVRLGSKGMRNTYWQLTVGGKTIEFRRSTQGISLVRVGSSYRVHYLCHSQHLLSIEPLS